MNTNNPTLPPSLELTGCHGFANSMLDTKTGQRLLLSAMAYNPGDIITAFRAAAIRSHPTYLTVQTGLHAHIILEPDCLQFTNHSCGPNIFFDTDKMQVVALEHIAPGDELTFFYPSTEWQMSQPFLCNCRKPGCLQLINGASRLDHATLERYRLTDFIRKQLEARDGKD